MLVVVVSRVLKSWKTQREMWCASAREREHTQGWTIRAQGTTLRLFLLLPRYSLAYDSNLAPFFLHSVFIGQVHMQARVGLFRNAGSLEALD